MGQGRQGYFDYNKLISQLPEYSLAQTKTEQLMQDSVNLLSIQYDQLMKSLRMDIYMDSSIQKTLNDSILKLGERITNYINYSDELVEIVQSDFNKELFERIRRFCILNKIDCLTEKQSLFYCDKCADLTDELINYLKKRIK